MTTLTFTYDGTPDVVYDGPVAIGRYGSRPAVTVVVALPRPGQLLANPATMTIDAFARNDEGAKVGRYLHVLDPSLVTAYDLVQHHVDWGGGVNNRWAATLTLTRTALGYPSSETIECIPGSTWRDRPDTDGGCITVTAIALSEDGGPLQPYIHKVSLFGLTSITIA